MSRSWTSMRRRAQALRSRIMEGSVDGGLVAGLLMVSCAARKITVNIPEALLKKAQQHSRAGVTATVRQGLELLAAGDAYEQLGQLRGKVKFSVDLKAM